MIYEIINNTTYTSLTNSYSQYTHDKSLIQENYRIPSIPESLLGDNFLTDKGCLIIPVPAANKPYIGCTTWHLYNLFSTKSKFNLTPMDTEIDQDIDQENKHTLLLTKESDMWFTIPNYIGYFDRKYIYSIDCDWIKLSESGEKITPEIDGYYKLDNQVNKIYYLGFDKPYCHDKIEITNGNTTLINYENLWNVKILNDNTSNIYAYFNEVGEFKTNSSNSTVVLEVW